MRGLFRWTCLAACLVLAGCPLSARQLAGKSPEERAAAKDELTTATKDEPTTAAKDEPTTAPDRPAEPPEAPQEVVGPVSDAELAKGQLRYYWKLPLKLASGEAIERLYRLDKHLYCLTNQNRLIAIDAGTGVPRWRYQVAKPRQMVFGPVHAADVVMPETVVGIGGILSPETVEKTLPFDAVMINTLSYVVVLDRKTGQAIRKRHDVAFDFAANSGGATDGKLYFVGTAKGWLVATKLPEGTELWKRGTDDSLVTTPPVYYNNHVYVAGDDASGRRSHFRVFTPTNPPRTVWTQTLGGGVTAAFSVGANACYVPCEDMRIYAFDALNGRKIWQEEFICRGPLRRAIQVTEGSLFQYAEKDRLYAINPLNGQKRWDMPEGRSVLAVMDEKAYVLDKDSRLRIVSETEGTSVATVELKGFDLYLANTTVEAIYTAMRDGRLYCIRPIQAGHLTPEMLKGVHTPK